MFSLRLYLILSCRIDSRFVDVSEKFYAAPKTWLAGYTVCILYMTNTADDGTNLSLSCKVTHLVTVFCLACIRKYMAQWLLFTV